MAGLKAQSVFITGANRGLGLELVRQFVLLPHPPKYIFATCRNPEEAKELNELAADNSSIHVRKFDVTDYDSYAATVVWVEKILKGQGLNILLNNAGQYSCPAHLDSVTRGQMMNDFEVNALVPLLLSKAFLPLLKKAASASDIPGMSCSKALIFNMSSRLGSLEDNSLGGTYSYRASKAAQNMVSRSLAVDLKPYGIMVLAVHPGWVVTDMGNAAIDDQPKWFVESVGGRSYLIPLKDSVAGMLKMMAEQGNDDSGKFVTNESKIYPW